MEPLLDIEGRTLCFGPRMQLDVVLDALLRMQNAAAWKRPITLYLGLGSDTRHWLGATEVLQVCSVIQCLRSPVYTVGLGLLHGYEPMVLAAGCRGHRYLLKHTLISLGSPPLAELPFAKGNIGLAPSHNGPSWSDRARSLLDQHLHKLARELGLSPKLFDAPNIVGAAEAIQLGLADCFVPYPARSQKHSQERSLTQLHLFLDHEV